MNKVFRSGGGIKLHPIYVGHDKSYTANGAYKSLLVFCADATEGQNTGYPNFSWSGCTLQYIGQSSMASYPVVNGYCALVTNVMNGSVITCCPNPNNRPNFIVCGIEGDVSIA